MTLAEMSPEELRAYNARAQQRRRDKTGNHYARSYRRATQAAVQWMKDHQPEIWETLLAEALAEPNPKPYCAHSETKPIGTAMMCTGCKELVGVKPLEKE